MLWTRAGCLGVLGLWILATAGWMTVTVDINARRVFAEQGLAYYTTVPARFVAPADDRVSAASAPAR
ncbi:MAG TPA: hypothetical protein PK812_06790, partial [Beijerinckiaceae bacterium]|nr:hypothetical protein [Beijerinckiaceae bacterium]